ncbi:MAG: Mur ligase family protein [Geminicoccaceae bacterium]
MSERRPALRWHDSRRHPGPGLLTDRPAGVLEAEVDPEVAERAVALWRDAATRMLAAVGWADQEVAFRLYPGGVSLAVTAPSDGLYSATLVNEWACDAASAVMQGEAEPDFEGTAEKIRAEIEDERQPRLVALQAEAERRGVACILGDGKVSVGIGKGSLVFDERDLPAVDEVDWSRVHDVPVAIVTGTNGKSTTVRLLAAIVAAAGKVPGLCTSDWVKVGQEIVDKGDYSGPGGARLAMRDPRVEIAVLELARGGIMRRGLPLQRADVAVVTNIAADHLGEFGVLDVESLADAKLVVAHAVRGTGRLVLNAEDPRLVSRAGATGAELRWFATDPAALSGDGAALDGEQLVLFRRGGKVPVQDVSTVPIAFGGSAVHNLANAAAALAAADALGLPVEAMAEALATFGRREEDNPGRGVVREIGGVRVLVDFAHNPHGVSALGRLVASLPAARRLVLLGQAGDRTDEEIRDLADAVWALKPDRIVIKEMDSYRRGRAEGEVPAMLKDELARVGVPPDAIEDADSETAAVRRAFGWAQQGDLLILLSHAARARTLAFLDRLAEVGWSPGAELPPS